ncbi:MAG: glucoamylase family protein, partial [bacterium]|nr:glucoamylase family protein [bacterium]
MKTFRYTVIFYAFACLCPGFYAVAASGNEGYGLVEFEGKEYSRDEFRKILDEKIKEKKKTRSGVRKNEKEKDFLSEQTLVLDDFSGSYSLNCLGGTLGTWEKDNTDITQKCTYKIIDEKDNRILKLEYDVDSSRGAYNGYWTKLNSTNLYPYKYLQFKVKGDGNRGFTRVFKIELKNSEEVGSYVVSGVTGNWQEIKIPLEDMRGITNWEDMRELVIVFEDNRVTHKEGILYFDDFIFSSPPDYYARRIEDANKLRESRKMESLGIATLDDDKLLDRIQKATFDFFWNESDPETGLIKDRSAKFSPCSVAAVGFGLSVFCVAEERGWVSKEDVYSRILKILKTFRHRVQNEKGFYYHFVDMRTGKRAGKSEVSSIDTALFLAGALHAAEHFKGTEIEKIAEDLYKRTNWRWMYNEKTGLLRMGWQPESGFLTAEWGMAAEEMIMYILAIGSPTYPVGPDAWQNWQRPVKKRGAETYIYCPGEPLFVYLFSHSWIDFRNKKDEYANYWENTSNAVRSNWQFCLDNSDQYSWYGKLWGLTASDGPGGYRAYGADFGNHDGTIAPYGILSSVAFMPEESLLSARYMLSEYGERIWTKYGFVSSFNPGRNWFSSDSIGIDQGVLFLMIEN